MKKIQILALSAVALLGASLASCNSGLSSSTPTAALKTESDTLAYAYGIQLAEGGLEQYLTQLGVIVDTTTFKASYQGLIANEKDPTKKTTLEKQLTSKLDSINKANIANFDMFIKGLTERFNSSDKSKSAYYSGISLGGQLDQMSEMFKTQILEGKDVNKDAFLAGLLGSLKKEKPVVNNAIQILENKTKEVQAAAQEKQEKEAKKQYATQIEEADKFMAENKTKAGIVTLPSGLQYKIVKEGKGSIPSINDNVEVFYKGSFTNGEVFETNVGKESVKFPVGQVIKGWTEALQLMPVGSKWILYIPYDLAYGAQGSGPIPPFSNLVFEIDLVGIVK